MPTLKSPGNLATEAATLATSYEYVLNAGIIYTPVDYIDGDTGVIPDVDRKCWVPLSEEDLMATAQVRFDTLFKDQAQFRSFLFMVQQSSQRITDPQPWLLIKTDEGLKALHEDGKLYDPDGSFVPNTIKWTINDNADDKAELLSTITHWVGGDPEVVTSLLRHLATVLAPHWSAGKYVLLIGNGRNGKSLLMNMLANLIGLENYSSITRQQMSEADKSLFDLNNKLLNIVFDGPADFVKDSGREKSLITGEAIGVRRLYANGATVVQTNALFLEGLNQEPRSKDKSSALQARLVRFWFPHTYADDQSFWNHMCSEQMLGAFLSLLLDHYVLRSEIAVMLAPSKSSTDARLEHAIDNSQALQFLVHLEETGTEGVEYQVLDMPLTELIQKFQNWRKSVGDTIPWDAQNVGNLFRPVVVTERRSIRVNGTPRKIRTVIGLATDARLVIESLRDEEDANVTATVVDD